MYVKTVSTDQNVAFQVSGHHGYHMNLLAQNYGLTTINQPHFVEPIVQPPFPTIIDAWSSIIW